MLLAPMISRTETSPSQIRVMESKQPPVYMISHGRVYRRDTIDATHYPIFHQVEGLAVDENITFCDLKGSLDHAMKSLFGSSVKTRFRPSFFPFTEPSAEVLISCIFCGGSGYHGTARCPNCKASGWIELLGSGMVDPALYGFVGYDPESYWESRQALADAVGEQLAALQISPRWLELEITESAVMANPSDGLAILTELDRMGITLAIDDFGTGYSSLAYLKRLPVDELKIDKSFVLDMEENENDAVIVRSTIDLAHNLGLKVTAEGVELQAAWDTLCILGCDCSQGYFMGEPMPAETLKTWLRESAWSSDSQVALYAAV